MRSTKEMPADMKRRMKDYLDHHDVTNGIRPEKFTHMMKTHHAFMDPRHIDEEDWLDLKNPLIVVLGDSITASYFETISWKPFRCAQCPQDGYAEKFLHLLEEQYPMSAPSLINSGIAGDNIHGMNKRLERDVLRYQPDLVILNASVNWSVHRGTLEEYQKNYDEVVRRIRKETGADLILMTANTKISDKTDPNFEERTDYVRREAETYHLPLVDIHQLYEETIPFNELKSALSNEENHPTPYGHTLIAEALMQCFREKSDENHPFE
jgi:acyl-CoA thioesterase-1